MKKLTSGPVKSKGKNEAVVGARADNRFYAWFKEHRSAGMAIAMAGIVVLAIAVPVAIYRSMAATGAVAYEAESGSLSAQITTGTDANASNGRYAQFTQNSGGGTVTLPNPGTWTNVTGNLAGMASTCGNLTMLSTQPGSDTVIAGVADRGLWTLSGTSSTWNHLGTGSGSATVGNRPSWISYDPANSSIFYESGIYEGEGIYKTTNNGNTFTVLGTISHDDYVSVDYSDPNRQTMIAGGHEQQQIIYKSTNGGSTWTNIGGTLPSGTGFSTRPILINSTTYVAGIDPSWAGGTTGIYRTTNGGTTWTKVSSANVVLNNPPLITANGTLYYSSGDGLNKSTDAGVTWTTVGSGLDYGAGVIELPDGRLVSINNASRLVVSSNGGSTWTVFGAALPYNDASGVVYSPARNAFFIWRWDCGNVVLSNAIMQLK